MVIVQPEERNMYDQHLLSSILREKYPLLSCFFGFQGSILTSYAIFCTTKNGVVLP